VGREVNEDEGLTGVLFDGIHIRPLR
jgi:hypothetical protein